MSTYNQNVEVPFFLLFVWVFEIHRLFYTYSRFQVRLVTQQAFSSHLLDSSDVESRLLLYIDNYYIYMYLKQALSHTHMYVYMSFLAISSYIPIKHTPGGGVLEV